SVTEDGTTNLVYTFTRTGSTTSALTVNYSIAGTAIANDYTGATPGTGKTITFAAGSSTATLSIDPTADTTVEPNETVTLTLATGTGYIVQTTTAVKGTITNDDTVRPKITLAINYSGISENSPNNFIYTFTRTGATTNPLTVNYNIAGTADANDYTGATPGTGKTITFTAGSSTATLTLDATADSTVEPNETISLQLVAGTGYNIGTTAAQIATIINDDGTRRHVGTNGKDVLLGTTANDYLIGGAGDDNLTGGAGGDLFSFATANLGNDRIMDFDPGQDTILVSAAGFGGGLIAGDTITAAQFFLGSTATNASQRFIYNSTNGALWFDVDGNGSQVGKQIATLNTGLALTFEDIFVS
ncbi:MAG: calcium-binding protein, partial [Dolichospermum sp.]